MIADATQSPVDIVRAAWDRSSEAEREQIARWMRTKLVPVHVVNRTAADVEQRRRERFAAEAVIFLDESISAAAERYGLTPQRARALVKEWRPRFVERGPSAAGQPDSRSSSPLGAKRPANPPHHTIVGSNLEQSAPGVPAR